MRGSADHGGIELSIPHSGLGLTPGAKLHSSTSNHGLVMADRERAGPGSQGIMNFETDCKPLQRRQRLNLKLADQVAEEIARCGGMEWPRISAPALARTAAAETSQPSC